MRLRLLGSRGAMLRLAAVACSLAVLGVGAFDHGAAQQTTVVIDVNETVGVSDSQQAVPPTSVGQNETVQVGDSVQVVPPLSIEVNEFVVVSESQQALPPASAQTTEAVQVSDQVAVIPPAVLQINESIAVSDSQRVVPPAVILVDESIGVSDNQQVIPPAVIVVNESIEVADTLGDSDSDGTSDLGDNCTSTPNANQADGDTDKVGNVCDNCPATANGPAEAGVLGVGYQSDSDNDARPGTQPPAGATWGGDACDVDDDNDGKPDTSDGCRTNPEDYDQFEDGDGCADADNDLDGICDAGQISISCIGSDVGKTAFFPPGHNHQASTRDCRNMAEDYDAFKDDDGCPEADNDNDNFPDGSDQCPGTDNLAGPDGALGVGGDQNHNGILDGGETWASPGSPGNDDLQKTYEDFDSFQDNDGCHDSICEDTDGDSFGALIQIAPSLFCTLFADEREVEIGTNPVRACAATPTKNDESPDPYPLDINDDGFVDIIGDIAVVAGHFGETQTPSNIRYDLDLSGYIDVIGDIVIITNRFGTICVPPGPMG